MQDFQVKKDSSMTYIYVKRNPDLLMFMSNSCKLDLPVEEHISGVEEDTAFNPE